MVFSQRKHTRNIAGYTHRNLNAQKKEKKAAENYKRLRQKSSAFSLLTHSYNQLIIAAWKEKSNMHFLQISVAVFLISSLLVVDETVAMPTRHARDVTR